MSPRPTQPTRSSRASRPPAGRRYLPEGRTDGGYRWDIHLQGDRETVFFAV